MTVIKWTKKKLLKSCLHGWPHSRLFLYKVTDHRRNETMRDVFFLVLFIFLFNSMLCQIEQLNKWITKIKVLAALSTTCARLPAGSHNITDFELISDVCVIKRWLQQIDKCGRWSIMASGCPAIFLGLLHWNKGENNWLHVVVEFYFRGRCFWFDPVSTNCLIRLWGSESKLPSAGQSMTGPITSVGRRKVCVF